MMAYLWKDALDDLASSKRHFQEAVSIFEADAFAPTGMPDYLHRMAFQHGMQAAYTSFEGALKRILAMMDEPAPVGGDWHRDLILRVTSHIEGERPPIIGPHLLPVVLDLMRFWHVAMHSYDRFDADKAAKAVSNAKTFLASIDDQIAGFRAVIDPPPA